MNNQNISLFNFVYSNMFNNEKNDSEKWEEFEPLCLEKVNYYPYDFIENNNLLVTMNKNNMWVELGTGKKKTAGEFVLLNRLGTKEYIDYKLNEVSNLINKYGINAFENLNNIFEYMNNKAIKEILLECRNRNIVDFQDNIFMNYENTILMIDYKHIRIILNDSKESNHGNTYNTYNNGPSITQFGDNNNANIEVVNDEKLFEILTEKLEAIKMELKDKDCEEKINELEEAIKKKDKKSVLEIISHLASIGSFIASGISLLPLA